jgi:LytS/YehU family sensor histidine kinase
LVLKLSDLFRYIFENSGKETTELENEMTFAREYAELLKARYGDLLQLEWKQNLSSLQQKVPVFLIQPILENSIRHGWSADRRYLAIVVDIREDDRNIIIEISDNGLGIKPDLITQVGKSRHALGNIAERLQLVYQNRGKMEISSEVSSGTKVCFIIPRDAL